MASDGFAPASLQSYSTAVFIKTPLIK